MASEEIYIGLEIGTSKICAVVGVSTVGDSAEEEGDIRILGVGEAPSRGVRKGEVLSYDIVQQCIREALTKAEQISDVSIQSVYLGVTGGHIRGVNNRGVVRIPEDQEEIDEVDVEDVTLQAREVSIPEDHLFVHNLIQHYYVDGRVVMPSPLGMIGRKLEADFHIVHGIGARIQNTIRCVKEVPMVVEDVVLNAVASAVAVLDQNQKKMGALVLDMGGGTTDYLVYVDGVVRHSGVLAVGGDHVNNDIVMGLRIPIARAARLKEEEGSVILGNSLPGETIYIKPDTSFVGLEVEREMLNNIINCRIREVFELIKRRLDPDGCLNYMGSGIVITGGCSRLNGIANLAEEVFGLPVRCVHAQAVSGVTEAFENPEYSTAIGLVKYAQAMQRDRIKPSLFARFWSAVKQFFERFLPRKKFTTDFAN